VHTIDYHDATKHQFGRFARSPGRLDWATQPNPFRRFDGAPTESLPQAAVAGTVLYDDLYRGVVDPVPLTVGSIGECLRCSFGLSAWKAYGTARWSLRVNPSSGNLHPTEAYLLWRGRVSHYAPEAHALEERARLDPAVWPRTGALADGALVVLTSIVWREAWKYGERAFRYCQHDIGHALGARARCVDPVGIGVAAEQAAKQRLGHVAGAEEADALVDLHWDFSSGKGVTNSVERRQAAR